MSTLLVICCWAGDSERIARHLPHWKANADEVAFSCPVDAPVSVDGHKVWKDYRSEQFGEELMRRMFMAFHRSLAENHDQFVFMEADALLLKPVPQHPGDGLRCMVHRNGDPSFTAPTYLHCPWFFDRATLGEWERVSRKYSPNVERGFPDRVLGLMAYWSQLRVAQDEGLFSVNQLDTPDYMAAARAVKGKLWGIHGIKTAQQYREFMA